MVLDLGWLFFVDWNLKGRYPPRPTVKPQEIAAGLINPLIRPALFLGGVPLESHDISRLSEENAFLRWEGNNKVPSHHM